MQISNKKILIISPWSESDERASMEKYAFQLDTEFKKHNISSSILPVKVNTNYFSRIFLPLFTSWRIFLGKEKFINIQYAFFINFFFFLPFLRVAKYLQNKKIILEIHEHWDYLIIPEWTKCVVKFFDLSYCRLADAIIVHNRIEYEILKELTACSLHLWRHPIDDLSNKKQENHLNDQITILMHGGIIRKKGFETGFEALKLLPRKYRIILMGPIWDKKYYQELIELVEKLGLNTRVTIIGKYVIEEEYWNIIRKSSIIIYPYLINTGSGAFAEGAMRFEKPFLTSDIDAMVDYIETKEFTFRTKDAVDLARKVQEFDQEKSIAQAAILKKKYSWNNMGIKYYELLNQL